ncbi:MAG: ATP12 family protein [Pseudomonadota bacterium]
MTDGPHESDASHHTPRMVPAADAPKPGPKRIYTSVAHRRRDEGYAIELDGRSIRTPARALLAVPYVALADALVAEWDAQTETIDHKTMPLTRLANTALDNVRGREAEIIDEIAAFAGNDLLCYRAETPDSLVAVQNESWDGPLAWAEEKCGGRFVRAAGVMHVAQPEGVLAAMRDLIAAHDAFQLTALHNMTTLTGSAILALAVAHQHIPAEDAWHRAHADEDWQISQWGPDDEAAARRTFREGEFLTAYRFLTLVSYL